MSPSVSAEKVRAALKTFDDEHRNTPEWQGWEANLNYRHEIEEDGRLYPPTILSLDSLSALLSHWWTAIVRPCDEYVPCRVASVTLPPQGGPVMASKLFATPLVPAVRCGEPPSRINLAMAEALRARWAVESVGARA